MRNVNTNSIRLLTVAVSLLFIPAFVFGVASIWAVGFGILLVLLFDRRLSDIIAQLEPMKNEGHRCKAAIGHYLLLMLEMTAIISVAPIILLYSGWADSHSMSALDSTAMNYAPLSFLKERPYAQAVVNAQILIAATTPIFISLMGILVASFTSMMKLFKYVMYWKVFTEKDGKRIYNRQTMIFYSPICTGGGATFLVILIFLYAHFLQTAHYGLGISNYETSKFIIWGIATAYTALAIQFASFVAIIR